VQTIHHGWGSCLSIFFPYPVFFFISSSHSNKLTEKPNQIHHKQAIKNTIFLAHSVASPTNPYPVSPSPDPEQRERRKQEGKLSGERGMRTGNEEQILEV
jgi:hypothetical protein